MKDILQEIIAHKRIEVEKQKLLVPPEKLAQQLAQPTLCLLYTSDAADE